MGWTGTYQKFSSKLEAACALEGFKPENVVASNVDKDGVYLAYRFDDGRVVGCVCLIETHKEGDRIETCAKAMSEDMWPFYYGASAKVLAALSPTTNENALRWRDGCRKRAAVKSSIKVGDVFTVKTTMSFNRGRSIEVGERASVCEVKRTKVVMLAPSFGLFTMRIDQVGSYLTPAEVAPATTPAEVAPAPTPAEVAPTPPARTVATVEDALAVLADANADAASIDAALALLA
jgi:hypothetical protein